MSNSMTIENPFATHGAISWTELASKDPEASVAFYSKVFGWEHDVMEMPAGDGSTTNYYVLKTAGVRIGGVMQTPCPEGTTMWSSYVTVDDVQATLDAAKAAGGKPMMDPMTVPGVGTMFGFVDPHGAVINAIKYENTEASEDC